ncbi:TonB-dependent receptor [Parahaliea maris]|uniref:TonB-dependent receptor n=1 Tax=Parahaliea maris TaxID=2716870 RepID=A0A5C9A4T0_9GAMM|nr:TonB-dependent receptor [Parahaliea maris]TXS95798.1 TonB-dependent receptor [Parahaliea maris]
MQSTPVTISAFGESALEKFQIVEASELEKFVPSLTIQQGVGAPGKVDLYLRGAGDQSGAIITSESGVGVYIDDVYMSRLSVANIEALELQRVEVLRGPQGTLYGRNSMTGAIKYVTKSPDGSLAGNIAGGFGSFDAFNTRGYIQFPVLEDVLAASVSGLYRESGDWYENTALDEDRGNREVWALNGKLALQTAGPLSGTLSVAASEEENDGGEAVERDPDSLKSTTGDFRDVHSPFDTFGSNEQLRVSADLSYEFDSGVTLRSITGYHDLDESSAFDLTGVGLLNRTIASEVEDWNQEFHLSGTAFGSSLDWIVGASLFQEEAYQTISDVVFYSQRAPTVLDIDTESYAVFAEGTYAIDDRLSLTAGIRWTDDEKTLDGAMATAGDITVAVPLASSNTGDAITPRFVVDYQLSEDVFSFLSISRGFRAGSFNGLASLNPEALATGFGPETVWAYEFGVKSDLMDGLLRANVNLFLNDFSDLQGLNTSASGSTTIRNIADARLIGLEAEFVFLPTDNLELTAAFTRQWDEYSNIDSGSVISKDFRMNRVSEVTANMGFEYSNEIAGGSGHWGLMGHVSYRSDYYNDIVNAPAVKAEAATLMDAGLFYETANGQWRAALTGKNLLEEDVYVKGLNVIRPTGIPNMPRTWSVDVRYAF